MPHKRVGRWTVWEHEDGRVSIELDEDATPLGVALEVEVRDAAA